MYLKENTVSRVIITHINVSTFRAKGFIFVRKSEAADKIYKTSKVAFSRLNSHFTINKILFGSGL